MLNLKVNPAGIDFEIQRFQEYLYDGLDISEHQSYGRVYKNQSEFGVLPEHYIGNREYTEVLNDDKKALTSFFVIDDNISFNEAKAEANISFICQVNLKKAFPSITHRADEEFINNIVYLLTVSPYINSLNNIVRGVDNVFSEFKKEGLYDMQDFFFVRFNITINYQYQCF